jgi:hypothetical protein
MRNWLRRHQIRAQRLEDAPMSLLAALFLIVTAAAYWFDPPVLRAVALIADGLEHHRHLTGGFWWLTALVAWLTPPLLFLNLLSAILLGASKNRFERWLHSGSTGNNPKRRLRHSEI